MSVENDKRELATPRGSVATLGTPPLTTDTESDEINLKEHNAVMVHAAMAGSPSSGSFVSMTGSLSTGGTFVSHNQGTNIKTTAQTASYVCIFKECPQYVKIKANRTDGNITLTYHPMTL